MMKTIDFSVADGKFVKLYHWDEAEQPKGVVQIIHGMAEHMARYVKFAKFLNKNGYLVYGSDLRGNGFNVSKDNLGWDEGNMWENDLSDQLLLTEYIKVQHPDLPIIVLGHSYGSFLTQAYMPLNKSASAFALSGSCFMKGFSVFFGKLIADMQYRRHGDYKRAQLMYDLTFRSYQSDFKGNGSWLTTDSSEVEKYKKDLRCGYVCSTNFYKWMFYGLKRLYKNDGNIDKKIPLLIFSGTDDAVGKYGKGVTKLYNYYQKLGIENIDFKLYEGGRHEMLNETNKEEVFAYVLKFFDGAIAQKTDLKA